MMNVDIKEKVTKSEKKIVAVQIPYEVYEKLKGEAEEDFISVSDVMRRIIIRYYRQLKTDTTK